MIDNGKGFRRLDEFIEHLLALGVGTLACISQILLNFEDYLILLSLKMSDPPLDLHRSPVIIQQFLIIQGRVHGLNPFLESVIRSFLLNDSTLRVDHIRRPTIPITEIERLSENICRFDGFYLPHNFRVFLGYF